MKKHYFYKLASPTGAPFWIKVPGTPFTLPGSPTQYERLPGMTQWAPRSMVERIAEGLEQEKPAQELTQEEAERGANKATGIGGIVGGTGGALLGRLLGGEKVTNPFFNIAKKGLSKETFQGLRNIPTAAKVAPLLGASAGALTGYLGWLKNKGKRQETAAQVAKGLLTEDVLQKSNILNASNNLKSVLTRLDNNSAHHTSPYLVTSSQEI